MFKLLILWLFLPVVTIAGTSVSQAEYKPSKVVYDISSPRPADLKNVLDRAGLLEKIYNNDSFEASIVLVIHGSAIPLFTKQGAGNTQLMDRASSFVLGEIIQFRICQASARLQGFDDQDFYEFADMIPMADAEIIQLQNSGYAYMR